MAIVTDLSRYKCVWRCVTLRAVMWSFISYPRTILHSNQLTSVTFQWMQVLVRSTCPATFTTPHHRDVRDLFMEAVKATGTIFIQREAVSWTVLKAERRFLLPSHLKSVAYHQRRDRVKPPFNATITILHQTVVVFLFMEGVMAIRIILWTKKLVWNTVRISKMASKIAMSKSTIASVSLVLYPMISK